jgi:hypothetical protein
MRCGTMRRGICGQTRLSSSLWPIKGSLKLSDLFMKGSDRQGSITRRGSCEEIGLDQGALSQTRLCMVLYERSDGSRGASDAEVPPIHIRGPEDYSTFRLVSPHSRPLLMKSLIKPRCVGWLTFRLYICSVGSQPSISRPTSVVHVIGG